MTPRNTAYPSGFLKAFVITFLVCALFAALSSPQVADAINQIKNFQIDNSADLYATGLKASSVASDAIKVETDGDVTVHKNLGADSVQADTFRSADGASDAITLGSSGIVSMPNQPIVQVGTTTYGLLTGYVASETEHTLILPQAFYGASLYDTTTGSFTVPLAGWYNLSGQVLIGMDNPSLDTNYYVQVSFRDSNGTQILRVLRNTPITTAAATIVYIDVNLSMYLSPGTYRVTVLLGNCTGNTMLYLYSDTPERLTFRKIQ